MIGYMNRDVTRIFKKEEARVGKNVHAKNFKTIPLMVDAMPLMN